MIEWSEPLGLGDAEVATDLAAEVLVDLVVVLVVPQTVSGSLRENSNEHKWTCHPFMLTPERGGVGEHSVR